MSSARQYLESVSEFDIRSVPLAYIIPAFFLSALVLPNLGLNFFFLNTLIYTFLYIGLGHSWNIMGGYTGQISLGHAVMFAIGGYTTAVLFVYYGITPFVGIPVGGVLGAVFGLSLGAITFRLRYHYFAIATLATSLGAYIIFLRWDWIGGAVGIEYPFGELDSTWAFVFQDRVMYFYIMWAFALVTTLFMYRLHTSKLGIYLKAINRDQELAENAGISAFWYKMYAMALSSFIASIGGGLFVQYVLYIDPATMLELIQNVEFMLIPVIGGLGTVLGPIVGAVIYIPTREYTRTILSGGYTGLDWVLFGTVLILIAMYRPNGLIRRRTVTSDAQTAADEKTQEGVSSETEASSDD